MQKKNSLELNQLLEKLDIEGMPVYDSVRRENGGTMVDDDTEPTMMFRNVDDKQYAKVETQTEEYTDVYKIETPKNKKNIEEESKEVKIEIHEDENKF